MKLGELPLSEIRRQLRNGGLVLSTGPFTFRIASSIDAIGEGLARLYSDYPLPPYQQFVDYEVAIDQGGWLRRWIHRQAVFKFDGAEVFLPLPIDHAFPLLEWSMNWCISMHAHQYLLLHSAVIERGGCAVILPAPPGSGKSTLCAALIHRGWRLLSDELALVSLKDTAIAPLGRPISLKNQSIDIIRNFASEAVFSRVTHDTSKGSVAHLKVPAAHIDRLHETAKPRWIVFPKYVVGSVPRLVERSRARSMLELGRNSFNYMVLGLKGFEVLASVVNSCECYDFRYSRLDDAVAIFDELAARSIG